MLCLFDEVLEGIGQNDREVTRRVWSTFETGLKAHLEAEELLIFPPFRAVDPTEVQALTEEHARFRARLDELGIAVDLHSVRADDARELVEALTAHSRREDAGVYAWAVAHLGKDAARDVHERLHAATQTREHRQSW